MRFISLHVAAYTLFAFIAASGAAQAQIAQIQDCPSDCPRIRLTKIGEIGGAPGEAVLMNWLGVPRPLGNGGWVTSKTHEPGVVAVYDSIGRLTDWFGREGGGPGEFRSTRDLPGPLGTTWVVDGGNQRTTVLGPNGEVEEAFSTPGHVAFSAPIDSQRVAVLGDLLWEGRLLPYRIHIMNGSGDIVNSIAAPDSIPIVREARRLYAGPTGRLYAAHSSSYAVQEWSQDGRLVRLLVRNLDWFQNGAGDRGSHLPGLGSTPLDSAGRMWAVLKRGGEELGPSRTLPRSYEEFAATVSGGTVIEVIDLDVPQVVARADLDQQPFLFPVIPFDGVFLSPAEDELGYVHFDVWKAEIVDSPGAV